MRQVIAICLLVNMALCVCVCMLSKRYSDALATMLWSNEKLTLTIFVILDKVT